MRRGRILEKVTLLQSWARGWLVRKYLPKVNTFTLDDKTNWIGEGRHWIRHRRTLALSLELCEMPDVGPEWQILVDKLNTMLDVRQVSKTVESCRVTLDTKSSINTNELKKISFEQDESDTYPQNKPAMILQLLRDNLSANQMIHPRNEKKDAIDSESTTQHTSSLRSEYPVTCQENQPVHCSDSRRDTLVARVRTCPPTPPRKGASLAPNPAGLQPLVPKAEIGKTRQSKNKSQTTSSKKSNACLDTHQAARPGKKERPKQKKKATREETVRSLSMEISCLSQKMKSVPKFSPEWTLSRLEMKLISDEVQHICAKSLRDLGAEISSLHHKMNTVPTFSPEWKLSKLEMKLIANELEYFQAKSTATGKLSHTS